MSDFILSIDQGTTSSRAILFSTTGDIKHVAQQEFPQHYPNDGWVEHNPEDIWATVLDSCRKVLNKIDHTTTDKLIGIGITNQRETTLIWDRISGEPIYNAIVWQDRRTAKIVSTLKEQKKETTVSNKTGLLLDPYFSATKISWILDNVSGARAKAESGELAFGTVDTFLLWRLTNGKSHYTDATNASRTSLFNIHTQKWDEELLKIFRIPKNILPDVKDCAADFGLTSADILDGLETPILGIAGDQQAALIGQTCFDKGSAKSTYGTGCFMIVNTGTEALKSKNRLLTTVAYRINGETHYALEGSIFIAGAAIQWLRDGMRFFSDAAESEVLAQKTGYQSDVVVVPAFTGLGAPYWNPEARGAIMGITRDTGIADIVTATLQSICFQTRDLLNAMEKDGQRPSLICVDGGLSANSWTMQCLSDLLTVSVDRPQIIETTALGVAFLVALQAGIYTSLNELKDLRKSDRIFVPKISEQQRNLLYKKWKIAIRKVQA